MPVTSVCCQCHAGIFGDWRITMELLTLILVVAVAAYGIAGCLQGKDYRPISEQGLRQPKEVISTREETQAASGIDHGRGVPETESLLGQKPPQEASRGLPVRFVELRSLEDR